MSQSKESFNALETNEGGYDVVAAQLSEIGEAGLPETPREVVVNSFDDIKDIPDAAGKLGISL